MSTQGRTVSVNRNSSGGNNNSSRPGIDPRAQHDVLTFDVADEERERAQALPDGRFAIEAPTGGGTRVSVSFLVAEIPVS